MKIKYEVFIGGEWVKCVKAVALSNGWLNFQLKDGTVGLRGPGNFRKYQPTSK